MKRIPVDSSSVASISYDQRAATLEVEFRNGGVYRYFEVPEGVYRELMAADSVGRYLNTVIKRGYRCVKL